MKERGRYGKALRAAFPHTLPILAGFLFLGMAYGILMKVNGFPFWYPMLMSIVIFGGSLEFVAVSMLMSSFAPLQTLLVALMIQVRHLFYGVSMLEKYKGMGIKKLYMIFGLCDETFSINCAIEPPAGVDRGLFMFFVTLLDHSYWITGATLGGILGSLLTFNTEGLDFAMTAMLAVIFLEQLLKEKRHITAVIGVAASLCSLWIFGADSFLLPTMLVILVMLTVLRRPIEKAGDAV